MFTPNKPVMMNGLIVEEAVAVSAGVIDTQVESQPETQVKIQVETQVETQQANGLVDPSPRDVAVVSNPQTQLATTSANHNVVSTVQPVSKIGGEDVDVTELGYGAFAKLKIENGEFDLDGKSAGKVIVVSVVNRKVQRLIKPAGVQEPTKEQMAYYVVNPLISNSDEMVTTKGQKVSDFKNLLKEEGLQPEEVEYEMVGAQILKFSKEVGEVSPIGTLAEMQIPSASMQKFRGLMVMANKRGVPMGQRVLSVAVGPKTAGGNGKTYNPWVFEPVNGTTDEVCAKMGIDLNSAAGISIDDLMDI